MSPNTPNKNVAIIAPTYQQCMDIYHPLLAYTFGLEKISKRGHASSGKFVLPGNVTLKLWSYEAIERMRGTGQYAALLDEVTTWGGAPGLKEAWESIVLPTMTTRWPGNHRGMIISTPKGYDYFYDLTQMQEMDPRWRYRHYTYHDSPYLDPMEIEKAKATMDPMKFAREYLASFEESGAAVFYMFNRKKHVISNVEYFHPGEIVYAGIDFNVGIQATSLFAIRDNKVFVLDEFSGHPDTNSLGQSLRNKFKEHRIIAFPDPSGRSRKTSAPVGVTDFSILESHKITCLAHSKAPPIVDSVAAVNGLLENANGDINMYVSSKCTNTIRSLERTKWVEGRSDTATIDKSEGIEHWSDGIRYGIEYLFPIKNNRQTSIRGFQF